MEANDRKKQNKLRSEIFGSIGAETLPLDYQIESTRLELKIPKREWDGYTNSERGKIMAVQVIQNRIELIRRVMDSLERNKKSAIKKEKG